jgi:hypothetical protein
MIGNFSRKTEVLSYFLTSLFLDITTVPKEDLNLREIANANEIIQSGIFSETSLFAKWNQFCCYLYYLTLKNYPVLVRMWYCDDLDRKKSTFVDSFTTKFMSKLLLYIEVENILKDAKIDNFAIKPNVNTKEVTAIYEKEDASITSKTHKKKFTNFFL